MSTVTAVSRSHRLSVNTRSYSSNHFVHAAIQVTPFKAAFIATIREPNGEKILKNGDLST